MIHSIKRLRSSRRPVKKLFLLPMAGVFLALSSCEDETSAPPPQFIVQTEPVGNGLAVIGFAMIGSAVVIVLGRLLR